MEIVIVRQDHKPWGIDGHLRINRQRVCDTVEHPRFHFPAGDYIISSFHHSGEAGLLSAAGTSFHHSGAAESLSEANHSECPIPFPFRHGDGALSSLHCEIIVGKTLLPGVVTQSQATYDRLYERLKKAFQRGTPVHLRIVG